MLVMRGNERRKGISLPLTMVVFMVTGSVLHWIPRVLLLKGVWLVWMMASGG